MIVEVKSEDGRVLEIGRMLFFLVMTREYNKSIDSNEVYKRTAHTEGMVIP